MEYIHLPKFIVSLRNLFQKGGKYQKAADTVNSILGKISTNDDKPFHGINLTNHGESRIPHCVKYDLTGFSRLVTIQNDNLCIFCYVGTHEEVDKWLEKNKGLVPSIDKKNNFIGILESIDIKEKEKRIFTNSDLSVGKLFQNLPIDYYDKLVFDIPRSMARKFEDLESTISDEELIDLCLNVKESNKANALFDIFSYLRAGDYAGAISRTEKFFSETTTLTNLSKSELDELIKSDFFSSFQNFEPDIIEHFIKTSNFQQWMMFMHPEQKRIVDKDFNGSAKLSGVSGSGKTCVVIKRAIRLLEKYKNEKILILTLNKSLSKLINELVDYASPANRENLIVKSFWELCQEELKSFLQDEYFERHFTDVTYKNNEHISQIWDEFYYYEEGNNDAEILFSVHQYLIAQNINAKDYLYQEFDYIRSLYSKHNRKNYHNLDREGRVIPFNLEQRERVLKGIEFWEEKMMWVGISDYLHLANELYAHKDKIKHKYRSILVDESQDFGNLELEIIRKLTNDNENDIFLAGDYIQKVSTKVNKPSKANINVTGRTISLKLNYRNSREILKAAYSVIEKSIEKFSSNTEDFEILNPEYSNFSTPKPLLLKAKTLEEEISFGISYMKEILDQKDFKKACLVICGFTFSEIKKIGSKFNLDVLDGEIDINKNDCFISDLEQVKGFEFDLIIIANCNNDIIPNPNLPQEEAFRDLSKLYVAMTRAKRQLILTYSKDLSSHFMDNNEFFITGECKDHCEYKDNIILDTFAPVHNYCHEMKYGELTGRDFLLHNKALGMSKDLQDKILKLVKGTNSREAGTGNQKEWKDIHSLILSKNILKSEKYLGKDFDEFCNIFNV